MTTATLYLPWPNKVLSPNARVHWGKLSIAKRAAKAEAYYIVRAARLMNIKASTLTVRVQFFPPDRRHRDTDNMLASCKAAFDGLSWAFGIDDSRWDLSIAPRGGVEKGGKVRVDLEWAGADEKAA